MITTNITGNKVHINALCGKVRIFLNINPLNMKRRLLYLKNKFVAQ